MTTETVETNQPDEQDGTFDRTYTDFKRLTILISKNGVEKVGKGKDSKLVPVPDGTEIMLTPSMKDVYSYLYTFQTNKDRRNYPEPIYPNMEIIAWENGITKPTAQKAVDDLMRAGVLIKDQIQVGSGFKSNNYVVLKPSKVVARGVTPPHPNASKYSTAEESGKNEQKRAVVEPAAPVAGKPDGIPVVDVPVDVDVPANDDAMNASDRYTDEQLGTKLRRWRNWGLDEEAKAFCLSHGISSDEDSMNLFIQNYHVPAPASVEQQVNAPADELPLDHDDPIPF